MFVTSQLSTITLFSVVQVLGKLCTPSVLGQVYQALSLHLGQRHSTKYSSQHKLRYTAVQRQVNTHKNTIKTGNGKVYPSPGHRQTGDRRGCYTHTDTPVRHHLPVYSNTATTTQLHTSQERFVRLPVAMSAQRRLHDHHSSTHSRGTCERRAEEGLGGGPPPALLATCRHRA